MASKGEWYAVYCGFNREKRAAEALRERGVEVYLPVEVRWRRHARVKERAESPLFVRYLFAFADLDELRPMVRTIEWCEGIVGTDGKPMAIPASELDYIRGLEDDGAFDRTQVKRVTFSPGQTVRIIAGPFTGCMAEIIMAKGDDRLRVLMHGFGGGMASFAPEKLEDAA